MRELDARTRVRPTARGLLVFVVAIILLVLSAVTGLAAARALGLALILLIILSLLLTALVIPGLRPRIAVLDDAVPAGGRARLRVEISRSAPVARWGLGRGIIHLDLPEALGEPGNVPLAPDFLCSIPVRRRGRHVLGRARAELRDLFALVRIIRRVPVGAVAITGLPRVETAPDLAIRRAGLSRDASGPTADARGGGEISPLPRAYVAGDDIRRIHWRASARTGRLMTREEEPAESESALVLLDTHRSSAVDDRLIDLAASTVEALAAHHWEVRVLDADGEEITRSARRRAGRSVIGAEADAVASRGVTLALADVGFGSEQVAGDDSATGSRGLGGHGVGGHVGLVVSLLPDDEEAASARARFTRWGGPGARRVDVLLRPGDGRGEGVGAGGAGDAIVVQAEASGLLASCTDRESFPAIVSALAENAPGSAVMSR